MNNFVFFQTWFHLNNYVMTVGSSLPVSSFNLEIRSAIWTSGFSMT